MVIGLIRPLIVVAQQVFKHRRTIYKVLTAQDKYISRSMKAGGYGKQAEYGVRSGALAGSIIGSFINQADDSPGNGAIPYKKPVIKTGKQSQTRYRRSTSGYRRNAKCEYPYRRKR